MEQNVEIQAGHNRLKVTLNEKQTFVAFSDDQGQTLQLSKGTPKKEYIYSQDPGSYIILTDGEILAVSSENHQQEPFYHVQILTYASEEEKKIVASINGEIFQGKLSELAEKVPFDKIKIALEAFITKLATEEREKILSLEKLVYVLLGTENVKTLNAYKNTIQIFDRKLKELTEKIKNANEPKELSSLEISFPTKIIAAEIKKPKPKPLPKPKKPTPSPKRKPKE